MIIQQTQANTATLPQAQGRLRTKWEIFFLILILAAAGILRFAYCYDMPVSGDEAVSLIQASGQAVAVSELFPDVPGSSSGINRIIEYSGDFGIRDVLESMRKAGMHPPFYYVFLHYILKFFGTGLIALRLPSVIFSTLSIAALYALCREVFPKRSALPAALLLAFSPYGIHYAHMIRPYPLLMLLSLLSTCLVLRLRAKEQFDAAHAGFWGYVLLSVVGLYTLYHYVFVFIFQLVFLLPGSVRDKRRIAAVLGAGVIAVLSYLPWLPSFRDQLQVVTGGSFYYFGKSSPLAVYRYFLEFNFTQAFPGGINWYKIMLALLITIFIGTGVLCSLRTNRGRCFAAAAVAYFVLGYAADRLMNMQTLNIAKLLFFVVPLFLLYLGAGLWQLLQRQRTAGILGMSLVVGILLFSSGLLLQNPKQEDCPFYLSAYRSYIRETNGSPDKTLVVINERARRSVFPLSHIMRSDGFDFFASDEFPEVLRDIDMGAYADVYFVSPRSNRVFEKEELETLNAIMSENGFEPEVGSPVPAAIGQTRLQHFKR